MRKIAYFVFLLSLKTHAFGFNNLELPAHFYQASDSSYIELVSLSNYSLCMQSNVVVRWDSNLPWNTLFTIDLFKGDSLVNSVTSLPDFNPIDENYFFNFRIPRNIGMKYGTDYFIKVKSGGYSSMLSDSITIGVLDRVRVIDFTGLNIGTLQMCTGTSTTFFGNGLPYASNERLTEGITYEWRDVNHNLLSNDDSINVTADSTFYFLKVRQGGCNLNTAVGTREVSTPNPEISNHNMEVFCITAPSVSLFVNYNTLSASFQWLRNDTLISGATENHFLASQSGNYKVQITDTGCLGASKIEKLNFKPSILPLIYALGNDTTLCGGNYISINCYRGFNYYSTPTFQWQRNGEDITINGNYKDFAAFTPGQYRLKLTVDGCTSYSKSINVISSDKRQKPEIQLAYDSIGAGQILMKSRELAIEGFSTTSIPGTWYLNDELINHSAQVIVAHQSGNYKLVVGTGTSCENSSDLRELKIGYPLKPKIEYKNTVLCGISSLKLSIFKSADILGDYSIRWKKDDEYIPEEMGVTIFINMPGKYEAEAWNGSFTTLSDPVYITSGNPKPKILADDRNLYCSNRAAKLIAVGIYGEDPVIQEGIVWYRDGVILSNETNSTLYTNQAGNYHYEANLTNGCVGSSDTVTITVGAVQNFANTTAYEGYKGSTLSISIPSCAGTLKWYNASSGGTRLYVGNPFTTPNLSVNTSYWVTCEVEQCESGRVQINVIVNDCPAHVNHNTGVITAKEYQTSGYINSSVNLPSNVKYSAGKAVILEPGFQVGANEVFEAVIGGCLD